MSIASSSSPATTSLELLSALCPDPAARVAAAPGGVAAPGPLGIIANFASTASQSDLEKQRTEREQRVLNRFALQAVARDLLPRERVAGCLRKVIPGRDSIDVLHIPERGTGALRGLHVCSSVWTCPVCSAKISERRRVELDAAVTNWIDAGRAVLMMTFTVQHSLDMDLSMLLDGLNRSYRSLVSGRWYQDLKKRFCIRGSIKAVEITYGEKNGWHPHLHVLVFLDLPLASDSKRDFDAAVKARWLEILPHYRLSAEWDFGVDIRSASAEISAYIAKFGREPKWTIGAELTKTIAKKGREGSLSPMEMLVRSQGSKKYRALWTTYAMATRGLRQLRWSPGLRALLLPGSVEQTDEEIANEHEDSAYLLASLTRSQWHQVVGNDARAELLNVAALGDVDALWSFLGGLGVKGNSYNMLAEDRYDHYTVGTLGKKDAAYDVAADQSDEYADYWERRL